jgi:hypothetical protein
VKELWVLHLDGEILVTMDGASRRARVGFTRAGAKGIIKRLKMTEEQRARVRIVRYTPEGKKT